jgi:hypothetical protein
LMCSRDWIVGWFIAQINVTFPSGLISKHSELSL